MNLNKWDQFKFNRQRGVLIDATTPVFKLTTEFIWNGLDVVVELVEHAMWELDENF